MIDRQARDLPLDAHLHTDLSQDSDVPIDVFAASAVERGIAEIAITDHVDFAPGTPAYGYTTFAQRERVVREAAERWADRGVAIRFGVEITWDSEWAADIKDHLATHAYDFVIGSAHVYEGSPYAAANVANWVSGRSLAEIVAPYFDEVEAAARSGLFDTLGHIDFIKRFLMPHVTPVDLAAAPELYERILVALVESGTALEINTSGLRHVANESYPSPATRRPVPRARWPRGDRRVGCPSRRPLRMGARRRLWGRRRRRFRGPDIPARGRPRHDRDPRRT